MAIDFYFDPDYTDSYKPWMEDHFRPGKDGYLRPFDTSADDAADLLYELKRRGLGDRPVNFFGSNTTPDALIRDIEAAHKITVTPNAWFKEWDSTRLGERQYQRLMALNNEAKRRLDEKKASAKKKGSNTPAKPVVPEKLRETLRQVAGLDKAWTPPEQKQPQSRQKYYTERGPEPTVQDKLKGASGIIKDLGDRLGVGTKEQMPEDVKARGVRKPLTAWERANAQTFAEKAYAPDETNIAHAARGMSETLDPETRLALAGQIQRGNDLREQTPFYGVTDDSRRLRVVDPGAVTAQGTFRYDYNTRKLAEQMRQQGLMLGETPSGVIVPVRIDENNQPQIVNARGFTPRDMMMRRPVETRSREQMMFDAMERAQATGQYNPRTAAAFARRLNNGTLNLPQLSDEQLAARERWRTAELARQAGGGQRAGAAMQLQMESAGTMWARQQAANPRMENPYEAAYRQQQAAFAARQRAAEAESQAYQAMQGAAQNTIAGGLPQNPQAAANAAQSTANPKQPTAPRGPHNPQ